MAEVPPLPKMPPMRGVNPAVAKYLELMHRTIDALRERTGGSSDAVATAASSAATSLATAQSAASAANTAQQQADAGPSGTAQSGTDTAYVTLSGTAWVEGPQVDLTGVSAGALTITGSGPQVDSNTTMAGGVGTGYAELYGEFRIVEDIGGVDTVLETFSFALYKEVSGGAATIYLTDNGALSVSAFSSARASTGAVSYRLDFRRTSGSSASVTNLVG